MTRIDLDQRTAIVTGAARGIGLAIAERLLASGARVALWDVDAAELEVQRTRLAKEGMVSAFTVDVTDESVVQQAVRSTEARLGPIDILVNNAGIGGPNLPMWEYDVAVFQKVFAINVTGTFLCSKAVIPAMRKRNYGRIINIASIAGKNGTPFFSAYSASKAAVIGLTKALAKELAETEILVNTVTPSVADTDILKQFEPEKVKWMLDQVPKGRFVRPDEIAAMVAWLASDECSFSTGQVFDITGGRSVY
jgi:NAD(P)-dependent dehydrogenase (short-subunit alcohol dehydrogenase family)